jgi:hypothetical protein
MKVYFCKTRGICGLATEGTEIAESKHLRTLDGILFTSRLKKKPSAGSWMDSAKVLLEGNGRMTSESPAVKRRAACVY